MNIAYIANIRLPTERAHGLQVMKMCEAFSRAGARVELVTPRKRHTASGTADPFVYYGVEKIFSMRKIASLDLLGLTEKCGAALYWLDIASFLISMFFLRLEAKSIIYVREPLLLLPFSRRGRTLCLEIHDIRNSSVFRHAVAKAHKIIAITTHLKDDLVALGIDGTKIIVAADGVDLCEFKNKDRRVAREILGLANDERIVLYTGHFFEWKGVDVMAHAAGAVPNAVFMFAGGIEPELSRFTTKFDDRKNIRIVPHMPHPEVVQYLFAADVLVLPNSAKEKVSARYTSPMKLFEYMAARRPIVASDLPSIRDVLDNSSAILVSPDDSNALAAGIRTALESGEDSSKVQAAYEKVKGLTWGARASNILRYIAA